MGQSKGMKLQVVLRKSDEGGYTVFVPALPGCVSEGNTREQTLANVREAIEPSAGAPGMLVSQLQRRLHRLAGA